MEGPETPESPRPATDDGASGDQPRGEDSSKEQRARRIAALCARVRAYYADHPPEEDYPDPRTFPPATEAQLRATEAMLGLRLPPFLRALYSHVGNGGYDL